jgi:predicted RNase H-like HicB family nuclease
MERLIKLHIEKLPAGVYLATSDDVQGLIAQGRTVVETVEIARDVARRLFEAALERKEMVSLPEVADTFDYPLVIGT